jgi:hypothetical protein
MGPADVILPASGTLVNQNNVETLTNKTLDSLRLTAGSYVQTIQAGALAANATYVLPATVGVAGQVLTKSTGNNLTWADSASGTTNDASYDWLPSDGATLTIVHGLNSFKLLVQILDNANNYANIEVDQVLRPTVNTLQLQSSTIPNSTWTVLIRKI